MASRGANRIRAPRRPMALVGTNADSPEDEFESSWQTLQSAFIDVHRRNAGKLSFEHLYRASYKIVLRRKGEQLYESICEFEHRWLEENVVPGLRRSLPQLFVQALLQPTSSAMSGPELHDLCEKFLRAVSTCWAEHTLSMDMVSDIMMYLDRSYAVPNKRPTVYASTLGVFRDRVLRATISLELVDLNADAGYASNPPTVLHLLVTSIIRLIDIERANNVINRALIHEVVKLLGDLYETDFELPESRLYTTEFEPKFLAASELFYDAECQALLGVADASRWLEQTRRRLVEEEARCATTLFSSTTAKLVDLIKVHLIQKPLDDFLALESTGIKAMIDHNRFDDLISLYKLVSLSDSTKAPLKRALQSRILALGLEIEQSLKNTDFAALAQGPLVGGADDGGACAGKEKGSSLSPASMQTAAAIKWVDDVLALKDKFDEFWVKCFASDIVLQSAMTRSFSEFINMFPRSSEYVSLFIDDNLKRGIKGKSQIEVDSILDKAIILLRYLSDRDMFERYYQKHLARRLLHQKSESEEVEQDLILRMKQEMGNHFTAKFEGMFKDISMSADLTRGYRAHHQQLGRDSDGGNSVDLNIYLLTTNAWPPEVMGRAALDAGGGKAECIYPPEIRRLQESFLSYYLKDRSGRILRWPGLAGNADIKCVFPPVPGKETGPLSRERQYELNVSTHGMIVLLLFNDLDAGESLSFQEVQMKTDIPFVDLARTLASLSLAPKCRVLLKQPPTKSVKSGDHFFFNANFASKALKIKVPTIAAVSRIEGDDERKETERKNDQTRSHTIDAAIVRIMKQRKQLSHTTLINEVVAQLTTGFKPEVAMIKKRIEDLISRDYLERIEDDTSSPAYKYLA